MHRSMVRANPIVIHRDVFITSDPSVVCRVGELLAESGLLSVLALGPEDGLGPTGREPVIAKDAIDVFLPLPLIISGVEAARK